jgi:uroporphyrinogen-III synthase
MMFLITRPLDDALSLATLLAERGYESVISPMLQIKRNEKAMAIDADIVVMTSRYAVPMQAIGKPCYVVGEQTVRAMPEREDVHVYPDAVALKKGLVKELPEGTRILYLRGKYVKADMAAQMPQFAWQEEIRYEAQLVPQFSEDALQALRQQRVSDVLFFSSRTAWHFEDLLEKNQLTRLKLNAWCLSADIAGELRLPVWRKKHVSQRPDMAGLLTILPPPV